MQDRPNADTTMPPPDHPRAAHVLVAEDDEEMRRLICDGLRRHGCLVTEATTGDQLLTLLGGQVLAGAETPRIDVVVSDVRMPGSSGLEVLASIRALGVTTPVILMTAFSDAGTRAMTQALHATLLDKPFEMYDLRTAIENVVHGAALDRLEAGRTLERRLQERPPRVLLAEDDTEMRTLVAGALRRDGSEVMEARDGRHLLAILESYVLFGSGAPRLDLIVSDIRMPGLSGLEVVVAIRSLGVTTPVILMTAFGDDQTRSRAEAIGCLLFDKPFDLDDLRTAVANASRNGAGRRP